MEKIYLASDHAGFALKQTLLTFLLQEGHAPIDMGPNSLDPQDDYPDYILPLARKVAQEQSLGIVIGLSGQGEAMAANRIKGVRATVYYGEPIEILKLSREHNNANVLSLGAKFLSEASAKEAVHIWLSAAFSEDGRHQRRIEKLDHV